MKFTSKVRLGGKILVLNYGIDLYKVGGHGPTAINDFDDDEYEVELHQTATDYDNFGENKLSSDSKDKSDSDP